MLTLFSYPGLYGLADNNPYGLKVYAYLRLCRLEFRHEHTVDVTAAPRGQLPYVVDDGDTVKAGSIAYRRGGAKPCRWARARGSARGARTSAPSWRRSGSRACPVAAG